MNGGSFNNESAVRQSPVHASEAFRQSTSASSRGVLSLAVSLLVALCVCVCLYTYTHTYMHVVCISRGHVQSAVEIFRDNIL